VRVVAEDGEQLGVMPTHLALEAARNRALDLVEVAPSAKPPVCKIMDFGKFRYVQKKRQQEAKKNQTIVLIKEIKFRPKIEDHDFGFKVNHILRFLNEGNKVKVTVMFRGREIAHKDLGREILVRVAKDTSEVSQVESATKVEGRNMVMVLAPKKSKS
jgi:translation initiation factor IF-3